MCQSITSLLYGQAVRTSSLLFAADASPRLEPVFRFVDLVDLRLRRGEMDARGEEEGEQLAVGRVPAEVWELVRDKVVDVELGRAEKQFVKGMYGTRRSWNWVLEKWDDGWWDVIEAVEDTFQSPTDLGKSKAAVDLLLSAHALASPPDDLFLLKEDPVTWANPRSATFVTIPHPSLIDFRTSTLEARCGGDYPNEHAFADVSFSVPPNVRQRFVSFIRLFHLEALQIDNQRPPSISEASPTLPPPPKYPHYGPSPDRPRFKFVPLELREVSPGWKLHTTCSGCW
ncbi:hypothetical protein JCM6882_007204 [Rhodosporidiobolus microsporus]